METTYAKEFITPLFIDDKRIGDLKVVAQLHFDSDLDYREYDIYDLSFSGNLLDFANWNYRSGVSLDEYLDPIIDKFIPEAKEYLQKLDEHDTEMWRRQQKYYSTLESHFV